MFSVLVEGRCNVQCAHGTIAHADADNRKGENHQILGSIANFAASISSSSIFIQFIVNVVSFSVTAPRSSYGTVSNVSIRHSVKILREFKTSVCS